MAIPPEAMPAEHPCIANQLSERAVRNESAGTRREPIWKENKLSLAFEAMAKLDVFEQSPRRHAVNRLQRLNPGKDALIAKIDAGASVAKTIEEHDKPQLPSNPPRAIGHRESLLERPADHTRILKRYGDPSRGVAWWEAIRVENPHPLCIRPAKQRVLHAPSNCQAAAAAMTVAHQATPGINGDLPCGIRRARVGNKNIGRRQTAFRAQKSIHEARKSVRLVQRRNDNHQPHLHSAARAA